MVEAASGTAGSPPRAQDAPEKPLTAIQFARKIVGRIVIYSLFPVYFSQAFALRRHALTLTPAVGPTEGRIGRGDPLHFLAVGDSIISGVGARRIQQSTVGHVARFMSGRLAREINWRAAGMIGAGARRVRRDVVPALPQQRFDAILLSVGVNDVLKLERSGRFRRQLLKLVRDLFAQKKPVAAVCHGPWVLCSTPALKGRTATGFHSIKDDMVNAGATWVDQEVVVDGNLITSRKPDDLPAFCREIVKALAKR